MAPGPSSAASSGSGDAPRAVCPQDAELVAHLHGVLRKQEARIRLLKAEIESRQEETARIVAENLRQNEDLLALNQALDLKVQERTRKLEESLAMLEVQNRRLQELSSAKESMTHMLVHDMKNPLTVVLGTLRLLADARLGLPPAGRESAASAKTHAERLLSMIEDMLAIARMESGAFSLQPKTTDMVSLLQGCVRLMQATQANDLRLTLVSPPAVLEWSLDPSAIERVVNNLLNNAIKYAPAGSEITLELSPGPEELTIGVANHGPCIPPEHHRSVFDLFSRVEGSDCSRVKGTGLGLAFCQVAVEAHGGHIGVVSPLPNEDHGCRFWFTLPRPVTAADA